MAQLDTSPGDEQTAPQTPLVSVIMANYNGVAYIADALHSLCTQTLGNIEIWVIDDGSTDNSVAIAASFAARDRRVRVIEGRRGGPGAARNVGLARATGTWIAVVDSDDVVHPGRLELLTSMATADGATIAIDDMLIFYEDRAQAPASLFSGKWARTPAWISLERFILCNRLFQIGPVLGYTKPVMLRAALEQAGLRYNEHMLIGEDCDLLMRFLAKGARLRSYPTLTYFYRKHSASISHRLDARSLKAMRDNAHLQAAGQFEPRVARAHRRRIASIERASAYEQLLTDLKRGHFARAGLHLMARPSLCVLLGQALAGRAARVWRRRAPVSPPPVAVCLRRPAGADERIAQQTSSVLARTGLQEQSWRSIALAPRAAASPALGSPALALQMALTGARREQLLVARLGHGAQFVLADDPADESLGPFCLNPRAVTMVVPAEAV